MPSCAQTPVTSLYWQAISSIAKAHSPHLARRSFSNSTARASASLNLDSPYPSSSRCPPSPSSSTPQSIASSISRVIDLSFSAHAALLHELNDKGGVLPDIFEEEVSSNHAFSKKTRAALVAPSASRTDPIAFFSSNYVPDPGMVFVQSMVDAIQRGDGVSARNELKELARKEILIPHDPIYLKAAVDSLLVDYSSHNAAASDLLRTPEEKLEWFLQWYSLIPEADGDLFVRFGSTAWTRQMWAVLELIYQFPTHLQQLSRILVLFAEKGYALFFVPSLLSHIARYGPPDQIPDLVSSVCQAAKWGSDSMERSQAYNIAVRSLCLAGHFHSAMETLKISRRTSEPFWVGSRMEPAVQLHTYRVLHQEIAHHWGEQHPYCSTLTQWLTIDHPTENIIPAEAARPNFSLFLDGPPTLDDLPRAIRLITRPNARVSSQALSFVLQALYESPTRRPTLLGLLHRRIINRSAYDPSLPTHARRFKSQEGVWIAAEMMRLQRAGRHEEALELFAQRYQWIGLPTGPRWDHYALIEGHDVLEDEASRDLHAPPRPRAKDSLVGPTRTLALKSIIALDNGNLELLQQDYASFLSHNQPRQASSSIFEEVPLTFGFDHPPDSSPSFFPEDRLTTPWFTPDASFHLPPVALPSPVVWQPWINAFAKIDHNVALQVLKDMMDRKVPTGTQQWTDILVSMVASGQSEAALAALDTMERDGGIQIYKPTTPSKTHGHSRLGPIESQQVVPPATSEVYIRLIRQATHLRDQHLAMVLEEKLRLSGCILNKKDRVELVDIYRLRSKTITNFSGEIPPTLEQSFGDLLSASVKYEGEEHAMMDSAVRTRTGRRVEGVVVRNWAETGRDLGVPVASASKAASKEVISRSRSRSARTRRTGEVISV